MQNLFSKLFSRTSALRGAAPLGDIPSSKTILHETLRIAWPSMVESFLLALVAFIDILMVSTLGESAISAVGLTNQPRLICIAVFMALSTAISALVARRKGENDRDSAVRILKLSLVVGFVLIAVISALAVVFANGIMVFAGSEPRTHTMATQYFQIVMGGMAFNIITIIINAAQRGVGNTKISMTTNIVSNVINIFFNFLLIGGNWGFPALGVSGAAIATVIGQSVGLVMAVISVLHPEGYICLKHKTGGVFDRKSAKALASIGSSSLVEQLVLRIGFLMYAMIVARLGYVAFATHNIAMAFMMISFSFGDGLSIAAVSLVSYSLGQERSDLAKIYGAFCQRIGLICSAVLSVIYIVFGRFLFRMFSNNEQILHDGAILMWLLCAIVLFQISQLIFSGCLRGAGDTKYVAFVTFIGIGLLRPALAYLLCMLLGWGIVGAWSGLILDQAIRLVMTSIRFYKDKWAQIKI